MKKETDEEPEKKEEAESEQQTFAAKAKARGRPKGSADKKARIKRIPIAPKEEEEIPKPTVKAKSAVVQEAPDSSIEEEHEEQEQEEVAADIKEPEPLKSPRTLRREHMQAIAAQKRAIAQARQDRFEKVLDGFMGF